MFAPFQVYDINWWGVLDSPYGPGKERVGPADASCPPWGSALHPPLVLCCNYSWGAASADSDTRNQTRVYWPHRIILQFLLCQFEHLPSASECLTSALTRAPVMSIKGPVDVFCALCTAPPSVSQVLQETSTPHQSKTQWMSSGAVRAGPSRTSHLWFWIKHFNSCFLWC